jgi:ferrochelatase
VKKAVLLVNIGTPESPQMKDVRRFLSAYLNDPHVIRLPKFWRKLLVNGIIVPFRAPKSAQAYRQLWTADGSPLRSYLEQVRQKLQERLGPETDVWAAMRYGNPNLADVMAAMRENQYARLTVIPLFPQYAASTTGTIEDSLYEQLTQWKAAPELRFVRQFYFYPPFLEVWKKKLAAHHPHTYDRIVFSFHGLPLSHLPPECRVTCGNKICACSSRPAETDFFQPAHCYKWSCYDFAAKMATLLGLDESQYLVTFQSRIATGWLQPYTDHSLKALAAKRLKVLVAPLSFVADCLETKIELGIEYRKLFLTRGGQDYHWIEGLNTQQDWIEVLEKLILNS